MEVAQVGVELWISEDEGGEAAVQDAFPSDG